MVVWLLALCVVVGFARPAAAWGQTAAPIVVIGSVDSQAYPTITTTLKVTDSVGSSLPGLAVSDFGVLVEGRPVPSGNYSVTTQASEPLSLVLALDVSVQWASFRQAQTAAPRRRSNHAPCAGRARRCPSR